ncbi:MAG: Crp/Fnr family transcriptional regulator [Anaerovoracaceae bacterium]
MVKNIKLTEQENLYLSLSPFTIPELFSDNVGSAIKAYLKEKRRRRVKKGYVFYRTGETADKLYYLNKGMVIETLMNYNGLEKSFLIVPCYPIGFHYCAHKQSIFPCTAAFTDCEVYEFGYEEFLSFMQEDRELLKQVIEISSLDFRLANSAALQNQSCSAYEKICQTVLSYFIAKRYNPYIRDMKITQELLAGLTGVHRVSVVRAIKKLKKEGIISYQRNELELLDYEMLQEVSYGKYAIR